MELIGISGYAGAGKDEVAKIFTSFGWTRKAFADRLKIIAMDIGWDGEKDEAGRALLQNLGTSVRENIHPDAWLWPVLHEGPNHHIVISDMRFPNEADEIKKLGGLWVRVQRPGLTPVNAHESETALDHLEYDYIINNIGTLADLRKNVIKTFTGII